MADLRRRKISKKKGSSLTKKQQQASVPSSSTIKDAFKDPSTTKDTPNGQCQVHTFWGVVKENPFISITMVAFMIPYIFYNTYLFVCLQHPEIISVASMGFLYPRPAVKITDPRQVLIIGTISSGTTQVYHDLKKKLRLEIGHENAETSWSFVRDGTVSWFHGIRYIPRPGIDTIEFKDDAEKGEALFESVVNDLCRELHPSMGFHPFMFRSGKCNLRQAWNPCWRDECRDILENEWGCGLRNSSDNRDSDSHSNTSCETPYRKILLQVRHPLRTIESLVTKFCINGVEGEVQPAFLTFTSVLFPQHDFSGMSCIESAGYYVTEYSSAMVAAKERGYFDDMFHVEEVTPCAVAQLAGFMENDVLFAANRDIVVNICNDEDSEANKAFKSKANLYNKGQLSLDWDDLLGGRHGSKKKADDHDLQKRVKKLAVKLGYLEETVSTS